MQSTIINKLIGKFVYETFVFNKVAQEKGIVLTDYASFLPIYRDILKTDLYASFYNEYYSQFEESVKKPQKVKKGGKK